MVRARDARPCHAAAVRPGQRARHRDCHSAMPNRRPTAITTTPRSWSIRRPTSSASIARCICPATRLRYGAHAPASRKALLSCPATSAFRSSDMLDGIFGMCICNDRRWPETYRVMGLQGRRDDRARLQYAVNEFVERRRKAGTANLSHHNCRCRPAPIRTRPGSSPSPKPVSKTAFRCSAPAASSTRAVRLSPKPRPKTTN